MSIVRVQNVGAFGVNRDLSAHDLPPNAWTDASNVRFLDGMAAQFYGHSEVYLSPSYVPQHVAPCSVAGARYWIYATATKTFCVTNTAGATVHTDISHATPRAGVANQWTSTLLSGIPILNAGDASSVPMSWNLNLASKFVDLANWPAATYCKSIRSFKNYLIALNITKGSTNYPYMVKWSHPADPGSVPSSWDIADATKDAGEIDLPEGSDPIVDGLQLRDSFMVYKETSCWRLDYVGGVYIFKAQKVLGTSGALNRNCIVELDGFHLVLSGSDVFIHDGQGAVSVLDKQTRRDLFRNIDANNVDKCFVFKSPFFNEAYICYPSIGSSVCDKAMVWNWRDKTIAFRSLPSANHAASGPVDASTSTTWASDTNPWGSDLSAWDGPEFVPSTARVIVASAGQKLYMLDTSAAFDGALPSAHLERRGLSFDAPEAIKLVRGIRPRITGSVGDTVTITVGSSPDPYSDPTWGTPMAHVIGTTVSNDCLVSGRYIAVKFSTGAAFQWRLDSYDIDVTTGGAW